jgi:transcriptional regulator with XRE-family HTH domain
LAKALGVAPITVTRWEKGQNKPLGLQAEVIHGLYNVALSLSKDDNQEQISVVRSLINLGIGALISNLLLSYRGGLK